jgi:hypothetical protein
MVPYSLEIVRLLVVRSAHPPVACPDHLRRPVACLDLENTILLRVHDACAVPDRRARVARAVIAADVVEVKGVPRTERVGGGEDVDAGAGGAEAAAVTEHGIDRSLPSEDDRRLVAGGRGAGENGRGLESAGGEVGGKLLDAHVGGLMRQALRPPDGVDDVGSAIIVDEQVEIAEDGRLLLRHGDVAIDDGPRAGWALRGGGEVEPLGVRCWILHIVHPPGGREKRFV